MKLVIVSPTGTNIKTSAPATEKKMTDKYRGRPGKRDPYFSSDSSFDDRPRHGRPPMDPAARENRYPPFEEDSRHDKHQDMPHRDDRYRDSVDFQSERSQRPRNPVYTDNRPPQPARENKRFNDRTGRRYDYARSDSKQYQFRFHGKTGEYFKIWIVNIFLTIITLYIYSAWAKVRTKRYFYGNTTIDNSSFEYHATGKQLVVGRLIAAALLIVYSVFQDINMTVSLTALGILAVMFPWALWRSLKFNAKASSFRNIRFGFAGTASTPYWTILAIPAAVVLVVGGVYLAVNQFALFEIPDMPSELMNSYMAWVPGLLLIPIIASVPWLHKNLISYSHNNHKYGSAPFSAKIRTSRIYGIYTVSFLLVVGAFILVGLMFFGIFKLVGRFYPEFFLHVQSNDNVLWQIITVAIGYAFIIGITGVAVAYFRSAIRNHRYNATTIGNRVDIISDVNTGSLWWLNTSNLALIIITLGLAYPYTKIRTARYFASRTSLSVRGGLDSFMADEQARLRAMGEEMADAFDVEFDIGI